MWRDQQSQESLVKALGDNPEVATTQPLIPVRYMLSDVRWAKAQRRDEHERAMPDSCPVAEEALEEAISAPAGTDGAVMVRAESSAEIAAAVENLRANERLLSADYKDAFELRSAAHKRGQGSGFRPSFLSPPHRPGRAPSQRKPSTLPKERADDSRPAIAVDLRRQVEDFGWMGGGLGQGGKRLSRNDHRAYDINKQRGVAPKDVHSGMPFRVKVQPPQPPWAYNGCLVYDETRTFEAYLPCHEPSGEVEKMMELIYERGYGARDGGSTATGGKGYFDAVRDGPTLKVFTDTMLTDIDW